MSRVLPTYSGIDTNFALNSPIAPPIQAAGVNQNGLSKVRVRMEVVQTTMKTGMDGSVAVSAVPGDMGSFELEVWQTSTLQQQLLDWYNACKSARDAGDVSNGPGRRSSSRTS